MIDLGDVLREVVGVDISKPMLDEARRANGTVYPNIRFTLNERPDLSPILDGESTSYGAEASPGNT